MLTWLSMAAAACAVGCAVLLILRPWTRSLSLPSGEARLPWPWRWAWPWLQAAEPALHGLVGWRRRAILSETIARAGYGGALRPGHVAAAQVLSGCVGAGLVSLIAVWLDAVSSHMAWLALGLGIVAALVPGAWLGARRRERARRMGRELPFLLDMMTLCMEAGLNVQGALQQAVERGAAGPLRDGLGDVLADVRAGMSRVAALRALAQRSGLPALHALASAIAQADSLGMNLGPVLRAQAERLRAERLLRAEQQALEAPVKMLAPLILCIFPCTFLVLGFPIGYRLLEASF
ncbi:Type II/IV secretion system protein TadC, associated with Flp pilus assembly [plant metagenome]|uniref:Type II/IV secretion system protein TadC, associated with Flp pilus assembly n=1 Tax=plant metagenome TaxID=1297885 RepID=A0A484S8R3_9ZZZZ